MSSPAHYPLNPPAARIIRDDDEALRVAHDVAALLAEGASQRDLQRQVPVEVVDAFSNSGLWGITVPREFGGAEVSHATLAQVIAIVSAADPSLGQIPQNHYCLLEDIRLQGSEEQKRFFGLRGEACRARIEAVLARVALPASVADLYPHSLSGGERQRVAIARALVCQPKLLICDEITSALDVSVQASILALLRELQAEGLTLLFVTHDLGVVRAIADRVVVLHRGRVIEEGGVGQVLERPAAEYTRSLVEHSPQLGGARPLQGGGE